MRHHKNETGQRASPGLKTAVRDHAGWLQPKMEWGTCTLVSQVLVLVAFTALGFSSLGDLSSRTYSLQ
eukprot:1557267-Amphidinium_carterae.1